MKVNYKAVFKQPYMCLRRTIYKSREYLYININKKIIEEY